MELKMVLQHIFRNSCYGIITALLLFFAYIIILNILFGDQLRFFAFTIDSIYLHWNVSFPAISVCEIFNAEKAWNLSESVYGIQRDSKLDDFVSDITFFNGKCYTCGLCKKQLACPDNITHVATRFRSTCNEILSECFWNKNTINCCDVFLPLETEFGTCFTINSLHTKAPRYRLISNRIIGPGILSFVSHEDIQIYLHAPNEIPFDTEANLKESVFYGSQKEIIIKVTEMVNDESVKDVSIDYRACRFPWERDNVQNQNFYQDYTQSTCVLECLMGIQIEMCNCMHHLMPRRFHNVQICDIDGLICLTNNFGNISSMRSKCGCLASCEEPEYNAVFSSQNEIYRDVPGSLITISLFDLPKIRYLRRVLRTNLDNFISVTSVVSLLFGLSIMSTLDYALLSMKYLRSLIYIKSRAPRTK